MTTLKLKCEYHNEGVATGSITQQEGTQLKGEAFALGREKVFSYRELSAEMNDLLTAYGLRALLADRTSDAAKLGVNKLDWMASVYEDLEKGDWFKKRVATGGIDRAMIHLIVELKECSAMEAESALKQASAEWKTAVKEKYASELTRIRADLSSAAAVDLTDM